MTQEEYQAVLDRITAASGDVDNSYKKASDSAATLCDVNQTMGYNPNVTIVRNKGGDVVGYDYKYTTPQLPNIPAMQQDSNIDSGLYATGGGGQTRGGGAGRYRSSEYAGTIIDDPQSTDKAKGSGFVSGLISPAWAAVSVLGKMGKHITDTASDSMSLIGDAFADGFENLLIPAVEGTGDSIRALFGADSEHGNVSMYLDEDTIGALSIASRDNGAFDNSSSEIIDPGTARTLLPISTYTPHMPLQYAFAGGTIFTYSGGQAQVSPAYQGNNIIAFAYDKFNTRGFVYFVSDNYFTCRVNGGTYAGESWRSAMGENIYVWHTSYSGNNHGTFPLIPLGNVAQDSYVGVDIFTLYKYGVTEEESLPGVSTEPGATVPVDAITGADPHVVAQQLEQQYPAVMGSPVQILVMDDSCNQITKKYYQVPISYSPTTVNITAPITGTTQLSPSFNPSISLPDIDMSSMIEQIVLQLSGSGAGDTIVQTEPSDTPGGDPIIKVIETQPPDTGSGVTPPSNLPQVSVDSMWHVYNPSTAELNALGQWLWSTNVLDILIRTFANPLESIMGVHAVYGEPSVTSAVPIVVGPLTSSVSARIVSSQYTSVDCGSIWLTEYFGNVFDYSPYTSVSLFLPFVGIVDLSVSDVMRAEISVSYNIDVYTGAGLAFVSINRDGVGGILYQYPCNCAVEYPVSGASYSRLFQSVMSAASSALSAGIATGGNPIMGAIAAGSSFMSGPEKIKVQRSGAFSGNIGAMGSKIPYLIISRPQINLPTDFEYYDGLDTNAISQLSACHGYTKCKEVHLNCPGAYKSELDEIESLLLAGVIFPD